MIHFRARSRNYITFDELLMGTDNRDVTSSVWSGHVGFKPAPFSSDSDLTSNLISNEKHLIIIKAFLLSQLMPCTSMYCIWSNKLRPHSKDNNKCCIFFFTSFVSSSYKWWCNSFNSFYPSTNRVIILLPTQFFHCWCLAFSGEKLHTVPFPSNSGKVWHG